MPIRIVCHAFYGSESIKGAVDYFCWCQEHFAGKISWNSVALGPSESHGSLRYQFQNISIVIPNINNNIIDHSIFYRYVWSEKMTQAARIHKDIYLGRIRVYIRVADHYLDQIGYHVHAQERALTLVQWYAKAGYQ